MKRNRTGGLKAAGWGRLLRGGTPIVSLALAGYMAGCSSAANGNSSPLIAAGATGSGPLGPTVRPIFRATTLASTPPPPLSGGTLLATRDGAHAVAADPDRDSLYIVDLTTHAVTTIALTAGDEPGRLVEDGVGRIHVALRSGGALVTIDPSKGSLLDRRDACPAPRGVAWDPATDLVWVACATGELVALPAAGGPATQTFTIERDLRDVIVGSGSLAVTKFRSAEVLRIDSHGTITRRDPFPSPDTSFAAHVAWRTTAGPSGSVVAVHQAESTSSVETTVQGGYGGGGCSSGGIARPPQPPGPLDDASISFGTFDDAASPPAVPVLDASSIVAVDASPVAPFDDGGAVGTPVDAGTEDAAAADAGALGSAAIDAGSTSVPSFPPLNSPMCAGGPASSTVAPSAYFSAVTAEAPNPCLPSAIVHGVLTVLGPDGSVLLNVTFPGVLPLDVAVSPDGSAVAAVAPGNAFTPGLDTVFVFSTCGLVNESRPMVTSDGTSEQPVAVAFGGSDRLLVQTREPAELRIYPKTGSPVTIALSSVSREDTGHDVFHTQAGAMIACASCHPEGRDDGHVWVLDNNRRRTPSLQGTIAGTAPYHWPGDEANLNVLTNDVYTVRMNGGVLRSDQMGALTGWVQTVPAPPAPLSSKSSASTRGQALFERADVGCATCHSGPKFTNNQTVDVGTGGAFQVPPLVGVGWRTPLMHDGCAATIADRFGACSTPAHGSIASLSAGDISDLVAYLQTL